MLHGKSQVLVGVLALLAMVAASARGQDDGPKPPPRPDGVADTNTKTTPLDRDAELRSLRERVEALERERAAEKASPPIVLDLDKRVDALEAKEKAAEEAADNPDYRPEVIPFSDGDTTWIPGNYAPQ